MGDYYCLSKQTRNAIAKNKEIDLILAEQKKKEKKEIRLLVLGSAESGKTTFLKQMRIIHGKGFSEDERRGFSTLVHQNIFQSMKTMTEAMSELKIPYANPQNETHARWFKDRDLHQIMQLQTCFVEAIRHLWADQHFMYCYKQRRQYQLLDSTKYFIDNLDRITAKDYIPTNQDILLVRSPTNGITEQCVIREKINFRIVDVGGQRGQRRKWMHYFENVTSLIFVASLSEYDQRLENNKNRMEDSLSLFYTTINSLWFADSSIILLLNKKDILEEKIQFSDLKTFFPGFKGRRRDVQDAMVFILNLYENKVRSSETENYRRIYYHFISATNNINSHTLFSNVNDTLKFQFLRKFKVL